MNSIDYEKLGQILYSNMSEEQQSCISIGMVPVEIIHTAIDDFKDSVVSNLLNTPDIDPGDIIAIDLVRQAINPELIKTFKRNLVVSIFQAAESENRMIA